jgi:hypothetical protein
MYWLFLLFALGAVAVAVSTSSAVVLIVCLLISAACLLAWVLGFYSARVGRARDDAMPMIDPLELHRLREQAQARKAATVAEQDSPDETLQ